jgi:hypothetical protein
MDWLGRKPGPHAERDRQLTAWATVLSWYKLRLVVNIKSDSLIPQTRGSLQKSSRCITFPIPESNHSRPHPSITFFWLYSPLWTLVSLMILLRYCIPSEASVITGFLTIFFYRVWLSAPRLTHNLEDQAFVFASSAGRVAQLYPQAPGTHFSGLLRHAWATLGLFLFTGHHTGCILPHPSRFITHKHFTLSYSTHRNHSNL